MNANLKMYEANERLLADKLLKDVDSIEDYFFTSGKVCNDIEIVMKDSRKIIGEVKVRNFKSDKYPDYILEVGKLISLCKKAKAKGSKEIMYFNFFKTDNPETMDFIVFNLTPRIQDWQINKPLIIHMYMNQCTYLSLTKKVEKQIIMLRYDENIDKRGTISLN